MMEMDGKTVTLLDAGMGTALLARGLGAQDVAERWLLERLDEIMGVHRSHVEAGAKALLTCTFNVHPPLLRPHGLHTFCGELRRVAVDVAQRAGATHVVGVIGPLPPGMPPLQIQSYAESAAADLAAAGAHSLLLETITSLAEGVARVAGATVTGLPVVASVVPGTAVTQDVAGAVVALTRAGAGVLGVNCATPRACHPVLADMAAAGAQALWAKPSAGTPQDPVSQADWVEGTWRLLRLGVTHVGGCCGVDARMLAALHQALQRLGQPVA